MACIQPPAEEKEKSDEIDRYLSLEKKRMSAEVKLLLLGKITGGISNNCCRSRRIREEHNCEANEDSSPTRVLTFGKNGICSDHYQQYLEFNSDSYFRVQRTPNTNTF
jgi:hypothetical protein